LNHEIVAGLRQAMRALNTEGNKAEFARALKRLTGDAPGETTVGRWLRDEDLVPAWAFLAAARAAGVSMDELLESGLAVERLTRGGLTEQIRQLGRQEERGSESSAQE
jgi:hypothetical protein